MNFEGSLQNHAHEPNDRIWRCPDASPAERCRKEERQKPAHPARVLIDEIGYLPINRTGADRHVLVIRQRYERGMTIFTTNQPFKSRPKVFHNDATLAMAVLDRILPPPKPWSLWAQATG